MLPNQIDKHLKADIDDDPNYTYRQYILIRRDANVSRGKLMVHAAHNSCSAILYTFQRTKEKWEGVPRVVKWFNSGNCQAKIIVSVKNLNALKKYVKRAHEHDPDIPSAIIKDAGSYEVMPECIIGAAIGPLTNEEAKAIGLKRLSLFK